MCLQGCLFLAWHFQPAQRLLIFPITDFIPWWVALCSACWSRCSGTASRSSLSRPSPSVLAETVPGWASRRKSQLPLACQGQIALPAGRELVLSPLTFLKCQGINFLSSCPLWNEWRPIRTVFLGGILNHHIPYTRSSCKMDVCNEMWGSGLSDSEALQ